MVRHAVIGHRPDDHALTQKGFVQSARRFLEINADKIPYRGNIFQPQLFEDFDQLAHAVTVILHGTGDVRRILQRRGGGGQRHAVHIERLAHAIQDIGHCRAGNAKAHA